MDYYQEVRKGVMVALAAGESTCVLSLRVHRLALASMKLMSTDLTQDRTEWREVWLRLSAYADALVDTFYTGPVANKVDSLSTMV